MHYRQRRIRSHCRSRHSQLATCHSQPATVSLTRESTRAMRERSRCAWPSLERSVGMLQDLVGGAERDVESRGTSSLIRAQYQVRSCGLRRSAKRAEASLRAPELDWM